ncbi:hypothetical protein FHT26_005661 [Rhizobacter sp. SG703]|nr:hypothetical protein [Rhizobacter sp. SG703]
MTTVELGASKQAFNIRREVRFQRHQIAHGALALPYAAC